jgi:hypothetical protein
MQLDSVITSLKTEYFVAVKTGVVITEEYNVTINSKELIGTTKYLTL